MKHALGDEVVALSLYGGAFALAGLLIDRSALRSMYWSSASRLEKTLVWGASLGLCVSSVNVAMRHPLLEFELFDSRLRPKDLVTGAVAIVPFAREGATECEWSWLGLFCAAFVTFRFASAIASRSMRDGVLRPSVVAFLSLGGLGFFAHQNKSFLFVCVSLELGFVLFVFELGDLGLQFALEVLAERRGIGLSGVRSDWS